MCWNKKIKKITDIYLIMINNLIKEDIKNKTGLLKIIQKMNNISLKEIMDLFGYKEKESLDIIQFFLNNTEKFNGHIYLPFTEIKNLGKLTHIEGNLIIHNTEINSLGNLEYVRYNLNIEDTNISDLGKLKYVGGNFYIGSTKLENNYTTKDIRNKIEVINNLYR